MWALIFIVSTSSNMHSGATSVVQEFSSKERCMATQQVLLQQANERNSFVLNNTCVPK